MTAEMNTGHGHVFKRPDGHRARCGGPGMCAECSRDLARKNGAESSNQWHVIRNAHVKLLTELHDSCVGDYEMSLNWAIQKLEGLPEHWVAEELAHVERSDVQKHMQANVRLATENARLRERLSSETPANTDAEDAAKWRALRNCARITAVGSAGIHTVQPNYYAHLTLNFWTVHPDAGEPLARLWLDKFVRVAQDAQNLAAQKAKETKCRLCEAGISTIKDAADGIILHAQAGGTWIPCSAQKTNDYTKRAEVMNPPASAAPGAEARNLNTPQRHGLGPSPRDAEARPAEASPVPRSSTKPCPVYTCGLPRGHEGPHLGSTENGTPANE